MNSPNRDVRITKTQRWLDLIAFLVRHHFAVSVDQVMNGVPAYREKWNSGDETDRRTVRRMFERDKDELRSADIALETKQYTNPVARVRDPRQLRLRKGGGSPPNNPGRYLSTKHSSRVVASRQVPLSSESSE